MWLWLVQEWGYMREQEQSWETSDFWLGKESLCEKGPRSEAIWMK